MEILIVIIVIAVIAVCLFGKRERFSSGSLVTYRRDGYDRYYLGEWFRRAREGILGASYAGPQLVMLDFDTSKERNWPLYGKGAFREEGIPTDEDIVREIATAHKEYPNAKILVPNMSVSRQRMLNDIPYVTQIGIFDTSNFDKLRNVSIPPPPFVTYSRRERRIPVLARKYLVSFKGRTSCPYRSKLLELNQVPGVRVVLEDPDMSDGSYKVVAEETSVPYVNDYRRLQLDSKFGIVSKGDMFWAYRLLEVMGAGTIPVILSDTWELPFGQLLRWEDFSVRVPEERYLDIPKILGNLDSEKMHNECVRIFEKHFETVRKQMETALSIVQNQLLK